MIEIGLEQKGENFIASALHLPTNYSVKQSSQSENKAFAYCLDELLSVIKKFNWILTKDNKENIESIIFNDSLNFNVIGLEQEAFEKIVEKVIKLMPSIHRFNYEGNIYTSYVIEGEYDRKRFLEQLFDVNGVEFEVC